MKLFGSSKYCIILVSFEQNFIKEEIDAKADSVFVLLLILKEFKFKNINDSQFLNIDLIVVILSK